MAELGWIWWLLIHKDRGARSLMLFSFHLPPRASAVRMQIFFKECFFSFVIRVFSFSELCRKPWVLGSPQLLGGPLRSCVRGHWFRQMLFSMPVTQLTWPHGRLDAKALVFFGHTWVGLVSGVQPHCEPHSFPSLRAPHFHCRVSPP